MKSLVLLGVVLSLNACGPQQPMTDGQRMVLLNMMNRQAPQVSYSPAYPPVNYVQPQPRAQNFNCTRTGNFTDCQGY